MNAYDLETHSSINFNELTGRYTYLLNVEVAAKRIDRYTNDNVSSINLTRNTNIL